MAYSSLITSNLTSPRQFEKKHTIKEGKQNCCKFLNSSKQNGRNNQGQVQKYLNVKSSKIFCKHCLRLIQRLSDIQVFMLQIQQKFIQKEKQLRDRYILIDRKLVKNEKKLKKLIDIANNDLMLSKISDLYSKITQEASNIDRNIAESCVNFRKINNCGKESYISSPDSGLKQPTSQFQQLSLLLSPYKSSTKKYLYSKMPSDVSQVSQFFVHQSQPHQNKSQKDFRKRRSIQQQSNYRIDESDQCSQRTCSIPLKVYKNREQDPILSSNQLLSLSDEDSKQITFSNNSIPKHNRKFNSAQIFQEENFDQGGNKSNGKNKYHNKYASSLQLFGGDMNVLDSITQGQEDIKNNRDKQNYKNQFSKNGPVINLTKGSSSKSKQIRTAAQSSDNYYTKKIMQTDQGYYQYSQSKPMMKKSKNYFQNHIQTENPLSNLSNLQKIQKSYIDRLQFQNGNLKSYNSVLQKKSTKNNLPRKNTSYLFNKVKDKHLVNKVFTEKIK